MKTTSLIRVVMAAVFSILFSLSSNPLIAQDYNIVVPDDYLTIQGAINAANTGDVIGVRYRYMDPYKENIEIDFDVDLTIIGFGEMPPIIDGSSNGHVIYLDGSSSQISLKLVNLRIINGNANDNITAVGNLGGGIYAGNSYVELDNCLFNQNSAQHGGGIYFDSSGAAINNCKFERNTTIDGGGAIAINGNLVPGNDCTITRTVFRKNNADGVGGAISLTDAKLILYHCDFLENSNSGNFGPGASALHDWNSDVTMINCIFSSNVGGAAYWYDFPSVNPAPNHHDPILESNNFWNNSSDFEGPLTIPVFVDGDPNLDLNFVPRPVSSCIDEGQLIPGFNEDYCETAPDIGAFDYCEPYTPPSDRTILCYLYECLNGDGWNDNTKWCSDAPLEDWFGITVEGNRVVEINVDSNGLTGELSSQLGNLDQLRVLNLFNNRIGGSFPTEIWNLTQLEKIDIYYNGIAGSIPANIGEFTSLIHLDIGNNLFGGPIPDDLFKLSQLEHLALNANYGFTSGWPYKFVDLVNLKFVNIGDASFGDVDPNNLPFPSGIEKLVNIECLNLSNNNFIGEFPDKVTDLTTLTDLQLFNNQLTGTIPEDIQYLSQLKYFSIWNNQLESPLPQELDQLTALEQLHLYDNNFTSEDCDLIQTLSSKPVLNDFVHSPQKSGFDFSKDCDAIPRTIAEADSLALVDFYYSTGGDDWYNKDNWLIGNANTWYGVSVNGEKRIDRFDLRNNNLIGSIPSTIGELTELYLLFLHQNQLSGTIPDEIGNLTKLRWFGLQENQVVGTIPSSIGLLTNMEILDFGNNQLSGEIPEEIYNLTKLSGLQLFKNNIEGPLSGNIGYLSNLKHLNLSENQLSGPVPETIGSLLEIEQIYLFDNNLNGSLPGTISNLDKLEVLHIADNQLSGQIPDFFGGLSSLAEIELYNNQLSGPIPFTIQNLIQLRSLNIYNNQLESPIPSGLQDLTSLERLHLNDNNFTSVDCEIIQVLSSSPILNDFTHSPQNNGFDFDQHCGNSNFDMPYCQDVNALPRAENQLFDYGWESSAPANLSVYVTNAWTSFDNSQAFYLRNKEVIDGQRTPIYLKSPGINVIGENPVVTWNEVAFSQYNQSGSKESPRNLYISTNGYSFELVDTYQTGEMPDAFEGDCWRSMEYSLSKYDGETIWWKWELESVNNEYTYWVIDNICFEEKHIDPVLVSSGSLEFTLPVLPFYPANRGLDITNKGAGVVDVYSFEIIGDQVFSWLNPTSFPQSIIGFKSTDGPLCSNSLHFDIGFAPLETRDYNATIIITTSEGNLEFPLFSQGRSCDQAINIEQSGRIFSPSQNTIYSYTPTEDQLVSITSSAFTK